MEPTDENLVFCKELVDSLFCLNNPPREQYVERTIDMLVKTLIGACYSREAAKAVIDSVIDEEPMFPAPATLRKHLRELGYAEEDKNRERDRAIRDEVIARKRELHGNSDDRTNPGVPGN